MLRLLRLYFRSRRNSTLSNGWGDGILWIDRSEAFGSRYRTGKPIILILHNPRDKACEQFRKEFVKDDEIAALSRHFVMVNMQAEVSRGNTVLQHDVIPYPQIYFFSNRHWVLNDIYSGVNPLFPHYYSETTHFKFNMIRLLNRRGVNFKKSSDTKK